jgi:thiamine pyrophosphate-dependent acetolactate synthase large subunit-like protein
MALGMALAYRGTNKLIVDLQPDGDLMFDPGALWVATHHNIPMLAVMYNNRAYYNDWEHQVHVARHRGTPVENASIGMEIDKPVPDYAALARSFGWYAAGPIDRPEDIRPALLRALEAVRGGTPALVDTLTQFR